MAHSWSPASALRFTTSKSKGDGEQAKQHLKLSGYTRGQANRAATGLVNRGWASIERIAQRLIAAPSHSLTEREVRRSL